MGLETIDRSVLAALVNLLLHLKVRRWHQELNGVASVDNVSLLIFEFAFARNAQAVLAREDDLSLFDVQLGLKALERTRVLLDLLKEHAQRV